MEAFFTIITHFPTIIYSAFLIIIICYWLLALLGLIDIEFFDIDLDVDIDGDSVAHAIGGFLLSFGLTGVPVTLVFSLLILFAWLLTCIASIFVLPLLPIDSIPILTIITGLVIVVVAFVLALYLTEWSIRPMKRLFIRHDAKNNQDFIGRECIVSSLDVNEKTGQAKLEDGGVPLLLSVRAEIPNTLTKGSKAILMSYNKEKNYY